MNIVGIVIEANPFHLGHQYLIDQCKEKYNPNLLIGICSGYFTMRGEISVLPKYIKTQILLDAGFDIILDLPTSCYLNSSQMFAEHSIKLLNDAGITKLVFGVENCTIDELNEIIKIEESNIFHTKLLDNLKIQHSFKKAYAKTLLDISNNQNLSKIVLYPNNTLAIEYIKAIRKYHYQITPLAINRVGSDDTNEALTDFPSGTALRKAIMENKDISKFITYPQDYFISIDYAYSNLNTLCKKLKLMNNSYYENFSLIKEGIHNYILNNYNFNNSFNENISNLANKKYSKSRIRRTLLSMILEIPNTISEKIPLKINGFSEKGQKYLKNLHNITYGIKDNPSYHNELEIKAAKLYSLLTSNDIVIDEFKFPRKG